MSNTAAWVKQDGATSGKWPGAYGSQGYYVAGSPSHLPSGVMLTITGGTLNGWTGAPVTDPRAPVMPKGSQGVWAWYTTTSMTFALTLPAATQVAIYCLDWDHGGDRQQRVDILDTDTGAVLDTVSVWGFDQGLYLAWNLSGNVTIKVTWLGGSGNNADVSGIFFDPLGVPNSTPKPSTTAATIVPIDIGANPIIFAGPQDTNRATNNQFFNAQGWNVGTSTVQATTDANGNPTQNNAGAMFVPPWADGPCTLTFQGTATVKFDGCARLAGPAVTANGVTTVPFTTNKTTSGFTNCNLWLLTVDPTDPPRNIQAFGPDADTTKFWRDDFLARLAPFSTLRFMDNLGTNNERPTPFASRLTPASSLQGPSAGGIVCDEFLTDLLNKTGKRGHINLVKGASDAMRANIVNWVPIPGRNVADYLGQTDADRTQTMAFFRDACPGTSFYFTSGNESWNGSFTAEANLANRACMNPDPRLTAGKVGTTDAFNDRAAQQYAIEAMSDALLCKAVFGARFGKDVLFLMQAGSAGFLKTACSWYRANGIDAGQFFHGIEVQTYVTPINPDGSNIDFGDTTQTADTVIDGLFLALPRMGAYVADCIKQAALAGIPAFVVGYEGNASLMFASPSTPAKLALQLAVHEHPRMKDFIVAWAQAFQSFGVATNNLYADGAYGSGGPQGFWASRLRYDSTNTPIEDGVAAALALNPAPTPPPVTPTPTPTPTPPITPTPPVVARKVFSITVDGVTWSGELTGTLPPAGA